MKIITGLVSIIIAVQTINAQAFFPKPLQIVKIERVKGGDDRYPRIKTRIWVVAGNIESGLQGTQMRLEYTKDYQTWYKLGEPQYFAHDIELGRLYGFPIPETAILGIRATQQSYRIMK